MTTNKSHIYTSKPYGNFKANDRHADTHTAENMTLSQIFWQAVKVSLFDHQK